MCRLAERRHPAWGHASKDLRLPNSIRARRRSTPAPEKLQPIGPIHRTQIKVGLPMNSNPVDQALQSEDRRFAAMANSDIEVLEEVLADDLHYTHANGMVEDKAEFI